MSQLIPEGAGDDRTPKLLATIKLYLPVLKEAVARKDEGVAAGTAYKMADFVGGFADRTAETLGIREESDENDAHPFNTQVRFKLGEVADAIQEEDWDAALTRVNEVMKVLSVTGGRRKTRRRPRKTRHHRRA